MTRPEIYCTISSTGQLSLNLSNPPPWLTSVLIRLPGGQTLTHSFTDPSRFGTPEDVQPPPPAPQPLAPDPSRFGTPEGVQSLAPLLAAFLDHLEIKEGARPHTLTGYRRRLGQFARWLDHNPDQPPASLDTWLAYYAALKRHQPAYSPNTLRNQYDALRRFGRWLHQRSHLPGEPLADVERPTDKTQAEPKAIERKHINAMLAAVTDPRDRALLLFFRDTGCRADEALQLTWGQLKLDQRQTEVIGKGDKARKLFFKPLTRRALEAYRLTLKRSGPDDPVWQGRKGPLTYDGLYKAFKRLAEAAGLAGAIFNPHAWRHAFGRDTTMAGIPTAQLQDLMGHSSPETTKIYASFNTMELQQAHDRYSPVNGDLT